MAAGVAAFPGFSKWGFACGHAGDLAQIKPAVYQPVFFTPKEFALIERLAAIIIPTDETPGADDAGVAEFIDLMTSRDPDLQHRLRSGLEWLNARSMQSHANPFLALAPQQQIALLELLAYKKNLRAGEEQGREFFGLIREYTIMGFYTSEVGLKELDFPGLRFYAESPACPHQDDPEHRHVQPAQA